MRTWILLAAAVLGVAWVWWMRRRMRAAYLGRLVEAAHGSPARARRVTLAWQSGVALAGVLLIALGMVGQLVWDLPAVRIAALLLVIAVIVPLGSIAGGRDAAASQRRVQVRRSAQQRLVRAGADGAVAEVVVRASRPFSYVSFALFLGSVVLLAWHDF